jgi:hypothetical protein
MGGLASIMVCLFEGEKHAAVAETNTDLSKYANAKSRTISEGKFRCMELSLFSQRFFISKCLDYSRVLVPVPPSFILSNAFEQAEHYQLFSWVITEAFAALIVP